MHVVLLQHSATLSFFFQVCDAASPYFGGGLVPVLKKVMCVSHDSNVLEDTNRLMPALNLLRYLFIRDRENQVHTHTPFHMVM